MPDTTKTYQLTDGERAVMQSFNQNALQHKAAIHDHLLTLEKARADLAGIEKAFSGAVTLMASTHGMSSARLSPDMTQLLPPD